MLHHNFAPLHLCDHQACRGTVAGFEATFQPSVTGSCEGDAQPAAAAGEMRHQSGLDRSAEKQLHNDLAINLWHCHDAKVRAIYTLSRCVGVRLSSRTNEEKTLSRDG